jgi:hypothetical protein
MGERVMARLLPVVDGRVTYRGRPQLGSGKVISINDKWVNVLWDVRLSDTHRYARINHIDELEGLADD